METETMGRVLTEAAMKNLHHLWACEEGRLKHDAIRRVVVPDALVDTGATLISLPTRLIHPAHGGEHMFELH